MEAEPDEDQIKTICDNKRKDEEGFIYIPPTIYEFFKSKQASPAVFPNQVWTGLLEMLEYKWLYEKDSPHSPRKWTFWMPRVTIQLMGI